MDHGPYPGDTQRLTRESVMREKSIGYASLLRCTHLNNSGATLKSVPTVLLIDSIIIDYIFLGLCFCVLFSTLK